MDEPLPNIKLICKHDLDNLNIALQGLPLAEISLDLEYHDGKGIGGNRFLSVGLIGPHTKYVVISKDEKRNNFNVSYHENGFPGGYDLYVDHAMQILYPLVELYNKINGQKIRCKVDSKESLVFRLPPKSKEAFNKFILSANKSLLHPLDWNRLYILVHVCRWTRVRPDETQFTQLLMASGFEEEYAIHIAEIFVHCLECLSPEYPQPD